MTEAKSPREIAEDTPRAKALGVVHWYGRIQQTPRAPYAQELADAIEQAIISYAAERERLLTAKTIALDEAFAVIERSRQPDDAREIIERFVQFDTDYEWIGPQGTADTINSLLDDACHWLSRLSSRPATEGKGDDD